MLQSNTDRTDAARGTNAPFQWGCKLAFGAERLPADAFMSIRIYCVGGVIPPARLHSIQKLPSGNGIITFADSFGAVIGYWNIYKTNADNTEIVTAYIRDANGLLRGHIACMPWVPNFFLNVASRHFQGEAVTDANDFILLPQCHIPVLKGACKKVLYKNATSIADASHFATGSGTLLEMVEAPTGTYTCSINVAGSFAGDAPANGFCELHVLVGDTTTKYSLVDKHLIIRAGTTSNLRVSVENTITVLSGVRNA